jgi:poly(3-hydroxybutyrate) depolymerase
MIRVGWLALLSLLVVPGLSEAAGRIYEVSYPAATESGGLAMGVTYRLWLPTGVTWYRGIIVHQHGCGEGACKGGETAADDLHWQALAAKWDCGLLGPSYHQAESQNCRLWCDPRNGSHQTFLRSLSDFAKQSGHAELDQVPWCLWGHSGGGFWASLMQTLEPDRIVAIWLRSGTALPAWEAGEIPVPEIPAAAYGIPVMCNPGVKERDHERFAKAWSGTWKMFEDYRSRGAPIGFAPDPRTSHECGDSRYLAIPFFDACLTLRLPQPGAADQTLKPISPNGGWRGIPLTEQIHPAASAPKDATVWLPDERVARVWAEYVRTGAVGDVTPPPAPFAVAVTRQNGGWLVTWDGAADLESGLAGFIMERDGVEIARLPEKPVGRFGRPLFQTMSYHDTPERPLPVMQYLDRTAGNTPPAYRVKAVNSVGLTSEPADSR